MAAVDDDVLINAVKRRPPIFNKEDKNHCNRDLITRMWNEICLEVGSDAVTCKTRWTSMRDYFVKKHREFTKPDAYPKSKKKWPLYDSLKFLIPYLVSIESIGSVDSNDNDSSDESETHNSSAAANVNNVNQPNHQVKKSAISATPLGLKRKFEDDSDTNLSSPSVSNHNQTRNPGTSTDAKNKSKYEDGSIEAKLDMALLKVLKQPSDNYHELFFKSLIPMVSLLTEVETVEFRTEVLGVLLKYLKGRRPSNQVHP